MSLLLSQQAALTAPVWAPGAPAPPPLPPWQPTASRFVAPVTDGSAAAPAPVWVPVSQTVPLRPVAAPPSLLVLPGLGSAPAPVVWVPGTQQPLPVSPPWQPTRSTSQTPLVPPAFVPPTQQPSPRPVAQPSSLAILPPSAPIVAPSVAVPQVVASPRLAATSPLPASMLVAVWPVPDVVPPVTPSGGGLYGGGITPIYKRRNDDLELALALLLA